MLEWVPLTMNLADRAAELRARYRLSTPDAIQLATAISHKATRFYGNDRGLQRVKEIECVMVNDLT
jgi:predicted nucleic acid-binding protein